MPAPKGKRTISADVDVDLYNSFAKACIDAGVSKTEALVRYIRYLQKQPSRGRKLLDEHSESDFKLDARKPR